MPSMFPAPPEPPKRPVPEPLTVFASDPNFSIRDRGQTLGVIQDDPTDDSDWKRRAWVLYEHLAEVGIAARMTANSASLVNLCPAKLDGCQAVKISTKSGRHVRRHADGTTEVEERPPTRADVQAHDVGVSVLRQLFGATARPMGLQLLTEGLFVVGEMFLVQHEDEEQPFHVVPPHMIRKKPFTDEMEFDPGGGEWVTIAGNRTVIRFYRPSPKNPQKAISSVKPILAEGETLLVLRQMIDATAFSNIHNGILGMPDELSLEGDREEFQQDLLKALIAPIADPSSPASVAPSTIFGAADYLSKITHIPLSREIDETLPELMQRLETRVLRGLDIPAETLEGMGGTNHWSSWNISAMWVRNHIEPAMSVIVSTITSKVYQPVLQDEADKVDDHTQYTYDIDISRLAGQPNQAKNAIEAFRLGALSYEALLFNLGFDSEADIAVPLRVPLGSIQTEADPSAKSTARKDGTDPSRTDESQDQSKATDQEQDE